MIDLYKVLEIENRSASKKLIKEKYKIIKNSITVEQDEGIINPKELTEKLEQIEFAHQILTNPLKKRSYDLAVCLSKENASLKEETEIPPNKDVGSINCESENWKRSVRPSSPDKRNGNYVVWISIILIVIGAFLLIKDLIAPNMEDSAQLITQVPTLSQKIINTPTISIIEDKENALKAAEKFSILMEEGDEGIKELLAPDSQYFDVNLESINTIIHDTLKYGKYIKIYDLSISKYSSQNVIISGYLENRSYTGWLKYYLDIYLSKYENLWSITSWNLVKT